MTLFRSVLYEEIKLLDIVRTMRLWILEVNRYFINLFRQYRGKESIASSCTELCLTLRFANSQFSRGINPESQGSGPHQVLTFNMSYSSNKQRVGGGYEVTVCHNISSSNLIHSPDGSFSRWSRSDLFSYSSYTCHLEARSANLHAHDLHTGLQQSLIIWKSVQHWNYI